MTRAEFPDDHLPIALPPWSDFAAFLCLCDFLPHSADKQISTQSTQLQFVIWADVDTSIHNLVAREELMHKI